MVTNELERLREDWWELEAARSEKAHLLEVEKMKASHTHGYGCVDDIIREMVAELIPIRRKQEALLLRIRDLEREDDLAKRKEVTAAAFEPGIAHLQNDMRHRFETLIFRLESAERRLAAVEQPSGSED